MVNLKDINFLNLLSKGTVDNLNWGELQSAYEEFVSIMHRRLRKESSYQMYYELGVIRLELLERQNNSYREGEKCLYSNNESNINRRYYARFSKMGNIQ